MRGERARTDSNHHRERETKLTFPRHLRFPRRFLLGALFATATAAFFSPLAARAKTPAGDPALLASAATIAAPGAPAVDVRDAIARILDRTVTIEGDGIYGSGVLVNPQEGLVLTAWHVVEEMKQPGITFFDGRTVVGKVVEFDKALDVALVQVPPQKGTAPLLGDATQLRAGEEVYAIGCPRHLGFTVSRGIVSYVGRYMDGARYVQTDLPINDGNSGGPVINQRGEVVGMMSFILRRAQGLSFALPVNYAADRFAKSIAPPASDLSYLDRFHRWRDAAGPSVANH